MRISVPMLISAIVISIVAGATAPIAYTQAQTPPAPTVYVVAFMKVDPAKTGDYLRVEREIWKPVHQERIRAGRMKSWSLYRVRFPYGDAAAYNFVTVNGFASLEDNNRPVEDVFAKIHPSMTLDEIGKRTFSSRSLQNGEAWERLEHIE